jgi:hypothetical protein
LEFKSYTTLCFDAAVCQTNQDRKGLALNASELRAGVWSWSAPGTLDGVIRGSLKEKLGRNAAEPTVRDAVRRLYENTAAALEEPKLPQGRAVVLRLLYPLYALQAAVDAAAAEAP